MRCFVFISGALIRKNTVEFDLNFYPDIGQLCPDFVRRRTAIASRALLMYMCQGYSH